MREVERPGREAPSPYSPKRSGFTQRRIDGEEIFPWHTMTKRQSSSEEFQWKITMTHTGAFSYGAGWSTLIDYVHDCYRRGACFKVEMKKLHPLIDPDQLKQWHMPVQDFAEEPVQRLSAYAAGRLPDGVFDEESSQEHLGTGPNRGDRDTDATVGRDGDVPHHE